MTGCAETHRFGGGGSPGNDLEGWCRMTGLALLFLWFVAIVFAVAVFHGMVTGRRR